MSSPPAADVASLIANLLSVPSYSSSPAAPNVRLLDDMLSAIVTSLRADLPSSARGSDAASQASLIACILDGSLSSGAPCASSSPLVLSASVEVPAAKRAPRKKRYADAAPSTHCHVCCRLTNALPKAVCRNIRDGTCRKVVCRRCIIEHGWDWNCATTTPKEWICPHCVDECGTVRAHCWVYKKTNTRRKMNGLKNKSRRNANTQLPPIQREGQMYYEGATSAQTSFNASAAYEE